MHFTSLIAAALLSAVTLVNAEFVIITTTYEISTTFSNSADASSWESAKSVEAASALSTYETHLTAQSEYASVTAAVHSILETASGVPPAALETGVTTTFTTVPPWFTALPEDIKSYYSSVQAAEFSIFSSVVEGAAARPTGVIGYMGAAGLAAGAAGAMLF
ncbi:hypothetical protein K432DRAFT_393234 [Lepidopterella palustris CBS 459.81]|uniref:Uncharacterized protein n=1 Tax=Lepidopterella palustris CBS 459.81 TaxID=1314670 RepID=A0A8E2JF09_9PEZI|nr:hypothetical protein K432DRAFT_393234 [Lepidopterella palustris CBS 459.81]